MTKDEIFRTLCIIDTQLSENKKYIDAFSGQEVPADGAMAVLCKITKLLLIEKLKLKKRLLDEYGIYYM